MLAGHQWEVRCLDWHPTKGLIVSGSKDHSVRLWDPRSAKCLTTLNSSKNQVSKTLFEPVQGNLLATCGRDQIVRIFDLRMMRDVLLLRGHENEVTSLAWHPIHKNLLATGGHQGAIRHYLLDEQNPPAGTSATLSPYDTPDPENAPAQTIYPAHSIPFAHEPTGPVWSLSWHPLGHILASGANDRLTRFWTRPRPGDTMCFNDRYHVGPSAAEANGSYNRGDARRQFREEEAQEEEDEADGLIDQNRGPSMPMLPGLSLPMEGMPGLPGLNPAFQPHMPNIPIPPLPFAIPQGLDLSKIDLTKIDPSKIAELFGGKLPPPPGHMPFPPPGFPGMPPAEFPGIPGMPVFPPGMPPLLPGMPLPQGYPPPNMNGGGDAGGTVRRRGPLPSQEQSLQQEQSRGRFTHAR